MKIPDKGYARHFQYIKKVQEQLKIYRQSVLKNACEGKLVPTEAELARAEWRDYEPAAPDTSGLSHYIVDCLHSTPKFLPVGVYCIDTNCIKQAKILFDKARFVSEEAYNERVSRLVPQPDDILFAREGTIGTVVIVPQNTRLCLGQRMMMFRAANGVNPLYFMWALHIKVMAMPLPPTLEQRRLSLSDKIESTIAETIEKAESLRQSILKKAFEGKLLNEKELEEARNAPDWEPAEKLVGGYAKKSR